MPKSTACVRANSAGGNAESGAGIAGSKSCRQLRSSAAHHHRLVNQSAFKHSATGVAIDHGLWGTWGEEKKQKYKGEKPKGVLAPRESCSQRRQGHQRGEEPQAL